MPPKRELDPQEPYPQGFAPQGSYFQSAGFFSGVPGVPGVPLFVGQPPLPPPFFASLPPPFFASLPPPFFASLPPPFFASLPPHFMEMQPNEIPLEAFTAAGYVASQPVVPPREQPIEPPSAFRPFKASAAAVEPDESSDFSYEEQPPEPKRRRKAPKKDGAGKTKDAERMCLARQKRRDAFGKLARTCGLPLEPGKELFFVEQATKAIDNYKEELHNMRKKLDGIKAEMAKMRKELGEEPEASAARPGSPRP